MTLFIERLTEVPGAHNVSMSNVSSADILVEFDHEHQLMRFRDQLRAAGCECAISGSTDTSEERFALLSFSTLSDQDFDTATRALTTVLNR